MGRHTGSTLMDINDSLATDGRKTHHRFVERWAQIKAGQMIGHSSTKVLEAHPNPVLKNAFFFELFFVSQHPNIFIHNQQTLNFH